MFLKYFSKKYLGWHIGLSSLYSIFLLQIYKTLTGCRFSEASIPTCTLFGINIGHILYAIGMFAAWGWIVTVPVGVIINFIITQTNKTYCFVCNDNINTNIMKRWLTNCNTPQIIALFLLSMGLIPGLIFILWSWNIYFCTKCNKIKRCC